MAIEDIPTSEIIENYVFIIFYTTLIFLYLFALTKKENQVRTIIPIVFCSILSLGFRIAYLIGYIYVFETNYLSALIYQ